jgi:tetratricopeptide (TPR) repeat protein
MNRFFCCKEHQKVDWGLHKHGCKYNPDGCEVCGKREGLQSCAGCMHRKYCCAEHQKEAWKEHKTICNVYQKLKLNNSTDPDKTAKALLNHTDELQFGREVRLELAVRVNMEILAVTKHFGLRSAHAICLLKLSGGLMQMNKFEEAEIFARDAVEFARDEMHELQAEIEAAMNLAGVLLWSSKAQETMGVCNHYLELCGTQDWEGTNALRNFKSQALSRLNRHKEALAQLAFVPTSKFSSSSDWATLSKAENRVGQLHEAIKSIEKAVELTRMDGKLTAAHKTRSLASRCEQLASLYEQSGRRDDAHRLAREAKALRTSLN